MAEGGGGKSVSRSGDTTAPDLLGQEAGDSGGMGGLKSYLRGMCEGGGLRGRGGALGDVMDTCFSGETAKGHIRRNFGGSKGVEATGISKAWQGRGRGGEQRNP